MHIRFITFHLLFLLLISPVLGQSTSKEELSKTLQVYLEIVESKNLVGTLDYIHPKLFEMVPRETMEAALAQAFADTTLILTMKDGRITNIGDILEGDSGKYSLVDYEFTMTMQYAPNEDTTGEATGMEFTKSMMEMQHGKDAVSFDEESKVLSINVKNTMYAIIEEGFDSWKFLEKKENMMGLINEIIPEDIQEKLH